MANHIAHILESEILPWVEKPSRYLGTELNSVHKDLSQVDLRVCLAFPDTYDIGLGNLGLQVLYCLLNREPGTWAERVYAPNQDLDEQLRRHGLPLFSLESRTPLSEFDAVGFTLQWELTYTNILHLLESGGIPILSAERGDTDPLILAGGPCVFNPEPLADFIDAFVIGDGEDVILELAEALREGKGHGRDWRLDRLSGIEGVYVPVLYPEPVARNGTLAMPEDARPIVKRAIESLDRAAFPIDYIVPYTQQINDRVSLEVLRGCTQGCRFCQSGMVTRPVRERSLTELDGLMEQVIRSTGYEQITLSSLSTCDHTRVRDLVHQSVRRGVPEGVSVGLPSLRLDSFSVELADLISVMGKSGLTFAPEAATDRMRAVINKSISDDELLEMAKEAYSRGWRHVKLYFMVGLPTEEDEDVRAIADLSNRVLEVGRGILKGARVNLGISTFVPKPNTPFQWDRQIGLDETETKHAMLIEDLQRSVKFGRHDARQSFLEGLISRGDRRTGKLILEAYRLGCRFDGWTDILNWGTWQKAFERWELDPVEQLRERGTDEPLPWDHIDILVPKEWQKRERERSRNLQSQEDCRRSRCNECGVIDRRKELCVAMLRNSREGAEAETEAELAKIERPPEPQPAAKLRLRFARRGTVRLLSHLETQSMFLRAIRRADLPVSYSQGFSPSPKVAFSCALPLGMETEADYLDLLLREPVPAPSAGERLGVALPSGFEILEAAEVPIKATSLMASVVGERYVAELRLAEEESLREIAAAANALKGLDAVCIERKAKKGKMVSEDILPTIKEIGARLEPGGCLTVELFVVREDKIKASAKQVLHFLAPDVPFERWQVLKKESYVESEAGLVDPISPWRAEQSQLDGGP